MANEDKTSTLLAWLQTAIELELATIPPYMVALLSIHPAANREAADLIRGVMIEEMLHLALVANVLNAVGGTVRLGLDNLPSYPLRLNFEGKRDFLVNLAPFSADNIQTFMKIEEPQALAAGRRDGEGDRRPRPDHRRVLHEHHRPARRARPDALHRRSRAPAPRRLLLGRRQPIIPVSDLDSARQALDIVIVQGEGAPSGRTGSTGHYYRFAEIFYQHRYTPADDPAQPPTGAPLPVDYTAVYPIKVNPKAADYPPGSTVAKLNDTFNARYTMMLAELEQALTGQPKVLYTAIMNGMHGLTSVAATMMSTPIDDDHTGCPTFNS